MTTEHWEAVSESLPAFKYAVEAFAQIAVEAREEGAETDAEESPHPWREEVEAFVVLVQRFEEAQRQQLLAHLGEYADWVANAFGWNLG